MVEWMRRCSVFRAALAGPPSRRRTAGNAGSVGVRTAGG